MNVTVSDQEYDIRRIFCIGRNYAAHAKELHDEIPESPVIFSKNCYCLVEEGQEVPFPEFGNELHHEVEVVALIGKEGRAQTDAEAATFVSGLAIGLDLTVRDVQFELIKNGLPWDICKAFDFSAPIGEFVPFGGDVELDNIEFCCKVNGELRQQGNTANMLFPITRLIVELSKYWTLRPGDIIYTGTPEGVGPLQRGDVISISGLGKDSSWKIV